MATPVPGDSARVAAFQGPGQLVTNFNTGYNQSSDTTLATTLPDDDWQITRDEASSRRVPRPANVSRERGWPAPFPDSRWISISSGQGSGALGDETNDTLFDYTNCFGLSDGFQNPRLHVKLQADDRIDHIRLNGQSLPFDGTGNFGGEPINETYTDPAYFEAGENCLTIVVRDTAQVATGLNVVGTMRVDVPNEPPTARFSYAPSQPGAGETVTFDATNSLDSDGQVVEYRWDFEGDGTLDVVTSSPRTTHSYPDPGFRVIELTVVDDDGATDTFGRNISVVSGVGSPVARCSVSPSEVTPGGTVTIDASRSENASAVHFDIDGDGRFERTDRTDFVVTVTYNETDAFIPVVVAVNENAEAQAECTRVSVVGNQEPTAEYSFSTTSAETGETVAFDASASTDPDGQVVEYRWDFDDDGVIDHVSTDSDARYTYDEPGTYVVTLIVQDDDGATDTTVRQPITVIAPNEPPTAAFDYTPSEPEARTDTAFDASRSTDSDGRIVEYRWDFDADGQIDAVTTNPDVNRTFGTAGDRTVVLTVVDDDGATASTERIVPVVVPAPVARCSLSAVRVNESETITIDASGSENAAFVRFDLDGDGTFERTDESDFTVTATYDEAGEVAPRVMAVNEAGNATVPCGAVSVVVLPTMTEGADVPGPLGPLEAVVAAVVVIATGVLAYLRRYRKPREGEPRRPFPKPRPPIPTAEQEHYSTGSFEIPAGSTTASVSVEEVAFEPDLILVSAIPVGIDETFPNRVAGWTHGVAVRTPTNLTQHALTVADDAHSTDRGTCATTDGSVFGLVRHGDGVPGRVRGRVTATTPDGFEMDVDVTGQESSLGAVRVLYQAFKTPADVAIEVGHLKTPTEPARQVVDLGIDADHVVLMGTTAVAGIDRTWTTDQSVGLSMGMAVGREPITQTVWNGSVWPGRGNERAAAGATDHALHLLYQDGDRIAGRTTAAVTGLGERIELTYDRVYSGPHKLGSTDQHVVTYLAMDTGEAMTPAIGAFRLPLPGETASIDLDFEPAMVEFATCGVELLGQERTTNARGSAFGWSHGTAIFRDDQLSQYALHDTSVSPSVLRPSVRSSEEPPQAAVTDGGSQRTDGEATTGAEGSAAVVRSLDDIGMITGRDELRIEALTETGIDVRVDDVSTDGRDPDDEPRPYVFYRAWPAITASSGTTQTAASGTRVASRLASLRRLLRYVR